MSTEGIDWGDCGVSERSEGVVGRAQAVSGGFALIKVVRWGSVRAGVVFSGVSRFVAALWGLSLHRIRLVRGGVSGIYQCCDFGVTLSTFLEKKDV